MKVVKGPPQSQHLIALASYPAFPTPRFLSLFHTASDKNLGAGKAGYEATLHMVVCCGNYTNQIPSDKRIIECCLGLPQLHIVVVVVVVVVA